MRVSGLIAVRAERILRGNEAMSPFIARGCSCRGMRHAKTGVGSRSAGGSLALADCRRSARGRSSLAIRGSKDLRPVGNHD
jgi:hypothetical protein